MRRELMQEAAEGADGEDESETHIADKTPTDPSGQVAPKSNFNCKRMGWFSNGINLLRSSQDTDSQGARPDENGSGSVLEEIASDRADQTANATKTDDIGREAVDSEVVSPAITGTESDEPQEGLQSTSQVSREVVEESAVNADIALFQTTETVTRKVNSSTLSQSDRESTVLPTTELAAGLANSKRFLPDSETVEPKQSPKKRRAQKTTTRESEIAIKKPRVAIDIVDILDSEPEVELELEQPELPTAKPPTREEPTKQTVRQTAESRPRGHIMSRRLQVAGSTHRAVQPVQERETGTQDQLQSITDALKSLTEIPQLVTCETFQIPSNASGMTAALIALLREMPDKL